MRASSSVSRARFGAAAAERLSGERKADESRSRAVFDRNSKSKSKLGRKGNGNGKWEGKSSREGEIGSERESGKRGGGINSPC